MFRNELLSGWRSMLVMAKESTKDVTARAREMLLGDRIPAIEHLAAAHAEVDKIDQRIERERAARTEALQTVRTRYEEAQKAGWSTRELRELGYPAPRAGTSRGRRNSAPTDSSTAPAASQNGVSGGKSQESAAASTTAPAGAPLTEGEAS